VKRLSAALFSLLLFAAPLAHAAQNPRVTMETSLGKIELELYAQKAPKTVANFLQYAHDGFYNGTIFHRVIKGFVIQGGGFGPGMKHKPTRDPIPNEADNGLKNTTGTIAMARTSDPNSATSQFFINLADNYPLDFHSKSPRGWGYCVFGKVIKGMDVVRKIEQVPTTSKGMYNDVPVNPVIIRSVTVENTPAPKPANRAPAPGDSKQ